MKSLKLDHTLAELIHAGKKTTTWRLYDDKDLSVNDEVRLIDKVDPKRPETWRVIGVAHITQVIEKRLDNITTAEREDHNYSSFDEMLTTFRKYYGDDVTEATPIKLISFTFLPVERAMEYQFTTTDIKKVKIYTDGGSRGNPGPSASGYVIIDPLTDKVLVDKGIYLGVTTNNQAEYLALKFALEEAQKMGANEVDVYLDSLLVVNQMKGIFKVKNRDLWPLHDAITQLAQSFKHISFTHVPRELNKLADAAVNRALDERQISNDAKSNVSARTEHSS